MYLSIIVTVKHDILMNTVGQKDTFFLIRVKRLYTLSFMDGSNPTHKLQLSIILYGMAKEKENSERRLFSQEPNPVDSILLTKLNGLPRLPGGSQNHSTLGSWSDSRWHLFGDFVVGRPCTPGHVSVAVSFLGWPDVAVRMSLGE